MPAAGANALLSCIFDGEFCGQGVVNYVKGCDRAAASVAAAFTTPRRRRRNGIVDELVAADGNENPYVIGASSARR